MQVSHAIRERRSIRAFLPDPIPAATITQMLELAKWAPSWANTQAWNVYVLTGEALARVKAAYALLAEGNVPPETDLPMPNPEWPEYLAERMNFRRPSSEALISSGGASSSDFYGAPCLLVFAIDRQLDATYACLDAGLFIQTFCLAAEDRGFATCIMARAVRYADVLHEVIPEARGKRFVIGVALGSADVDAVVNRGERTRVELTELATVIDDAE